MFQASQTVAEIATRHPESVRVFQRLGIDFCCGGGLSLSEACAKKGLAVTATLEALDSEAQRGLREAPPPVEGRLADLVTYLLDTHHVFTRQELERLAPLADKVARVHGERHSELVEVRALFVALSDDLVSHLAKEEQILFPYIKARELAQLEGGPEPSRCFGDVDGPVAVMRMEHETAGDILRRLRTVTGGYAPPPDACGSYRALYHGLEALEADLHTHIHLENNVLFPRALALEGR